MALSLAIIEVAHTTGTFEGRQNLFSLKKVFATSIVILAILDWIILSFVTTHEWPKFFCETLPWGIINISIAIVLL